MHRRLIPGLDASLFVDEEGRTYWAIEADWVPCRRNGNVRKSGKGKGRDDSPEQEGQATIWNALAERRIHPMLAEGSEN